MSVNFDIDAVVQKLVLTDNIKEKETLAREIQAQAAEKGTFLASIHDVYLARGKGKGKNFTVPAMNLRSLTYYLARAIFRTAKKLNAGAFIFARWPLDRHDSGCAALSKRKLRAVQRSWRQALRRRARHRAGQVRGNMVRHGGQRYRL